METKRHPALAVLEFDSVAAGITAADTLVKRSPIALLKVGTVHPGHYLILMAGTVAAVEEAHVAAVSTGAEWMTAQVLLADIDPQVYDAVLGVRHAPVADTLGVIETRSVPDLLLAADAMKKSTMIEIVELRLADDLGGRALLVLSGEMADVEDARRIATENIGHDALFNTTVVPRLDASLQTIIGAGTGFAACEPVEPEGAEQHASG